MHYPPRSLRAALALSRSAAVEALWQRAEHLPEGGGVGGGEGGGGVGGSEGGEGGDDGGAHESLGPPLQHTFHVAKPGTVELSSSVSS